MNPKCVEAVARAAGRALKQSEIDDIDSRIRDAARRLARQDRAKWMSMSADDRTMAAAEQAAADMKAEAERTYRNAQLAALKTVQTENRLEAALAHGGKRAHALVEDITRVQENATAIKNESIGQLMDYITAVKSKEGASFARRVAMYLFDADNPAMTRDLFHEIFANADGSTGNAIAQKGARAWLDVIGAMRERFNRSGGDVGLLDYGYMPQPHDSSKVLGKGGNAARDAWVNKLMPKLARDRYVNEDGTLMSDDQVADVMRYAWETIGSDGLNKLEPGKGGLPGASARANRGSQSRQIHFKDADAYLEYMREYGKGTAFQAMIGHLGRISKDIALVEAYGPNPNSQMRLQFELAAKADGRPVTDLPKSFGVRPQTYWGLVNGELSTPASARISEVAQTIRSIETFGKLQGTLIASISDLHTIAVTAGVNKLPYFQLLKDISLASFHGETKDFLTMHGIIAESLAGELNRISGDLLNPSLAGKLANSTMKVSLLQAWTDGLRRGFSLSMMGALGKMGQTPWEKLYSYDRTRLERAGFTPDDWGVINRTQLTEYRGRQLLTPESIHDTGAPRAQEVVQKVLAFINNEAETAVLNPDLATRGVTTWGIQAGTVPGELARAVMQFKAFPIALISRHWRRMLSLPTGFEEGQPLMANRYVYASSFLLSSVMLGAIIEQINQLRNGKDPIDMTRPKFWLQAAVRGGGLAFVGDMLLQDPNSQFGSPGANALKSLAGPSLGAMFDLVYGMGIGGIYKAANGRPTDTGAQAVNLARSHTPFVNLWYLKAAIDHGFMNALQENLSPGYLGRQQQKAAQEWGQSFYWAPQDKTPSRAPDLSKAFGG
ncbi:hypothetical protein KTE23_11250 [Burkholderia multivorans]|uniref:hypothetical protein n=1 Tax=Burkholderia multivorans TaxID=87883 RepID=UPI001C244165|nr:hypothetical protein [Burkholderia multivorans]MBU9417147.1 hypothetical protein [Burkholderia multivorans]